MSVSGKSTRLSNCTSSLFCRGFQSKVLVRVHFVRKKSKPFIIHVLLQERHKFCLEESPVNARFYVPAMEKVSFSNDIDVQVRSNESTVMHSREHILFHRSVFYQCNHDVNRCLPEVPHYLHLGME